MRVFLLIVQRVESYKGQHAPEVIDAIDEYTLEENSSYMATRENILNEKYRLKDSAVIQSYKWFEIVVDEDEIKKHLALSIPKLNVKPGLMF